MITSSDSPVQNNKTVNHDLSETDVTQKSLKVSQSLMHLRFKSEAELAT